MRPGSSFAQMCDTPAMLTSPRHLRVRTTARVWLVVAAWLGGQGALPAPAWGEPLALTYADTVARAVREAPQVVAARTRIAIAEAEVAIAGVLPNPSVWAGSSTQAARLSAGVSLPLLILGQRSAAMAAGQADQAAVQADIDVTRQDVRAAAGHAYVALWLAEKTAAARRQAATVAAQLDDAVTQRIAVGSAPRFEGLRAHADRLRADAEAVEAQALVVAAAVDLGRWLAVQEPEDLRTAGDPDVPDQSPALISLRDRANRAPAVLREEAAARAADAHADRERALVRPALVLDVGADIGDPTLPATNYRAQLGVELPLLSQRRPQVQREQAAAQAARVRATSERAMASADLVVAYRTFEAHSSRFASFRDVVVPATNQAAQAMRDAYRLGRASLAAVLEAERAHIETSLGLLQAQAARAGDWIDLEHALGTQNKGAQP